MVRAVLVASRHAHQPDRLYEYRNLLNRALAGANIEPREPLFVRRSGVSTALLNPNGAARMLGASTAVGMLLDGDDDWHVPGAPLPDGSFALLRADDSQVELAADSVASRTLWYSLTEHEFIASTSQRAIVTLLGSFAPNRDVLPWMLSSGTLGPSQAWDTRIRRLQPGERVVLDRARWSLRSTRETLPFAPDTQLSRAEHLDRLLAAVTHACRSSSQAAKWVLTLSGGADSRSLLCLLRERGIGTVTWGLRGSIDQHGNDAQVAKALAHALDVPHRFFVIDPSTTDPDVVFDRFLAAGEGRVARISGYLDGFAIWKTLFEEGYDGVIRGDEAFGSLPVASSFAARHFAGLTTLEDHFAEEEIERFELPKQIVPRHLERRRDESLATWRDRLYQQFRAPSMLAGLTDLKTAYVEVGTPLLARSVLECVRTLPDPLRTAKRLWRELVGVQVPNMALATSVAIPSLEDYLRNRNVLELLIDELNSERAASVFAPLLRARCSAALRAALRTAPAAPPPRRLEQRPRLLARAVPERLREALRLCRPAPRGVEPLVLAFRAFLAIRMHTLLAADSATTPPVDQRSAITA